MHCVERRSVHRKTCSGGGEEGSTGRGLAAGMQNTAACVVLPWLSRQGPAGQLDLRTPLRTTQL